jgi:motility quorum-sensing regulator / GCU-specific mRNA interferase toxin
LEKSRPTHDLRRVKEVLANAASLAITTSALQDATALGYDREAIAEVVSGMTGSMFRKSMTTYADHRAWQDVYHVPVDGLLLYVKVGADAVTAFRLVSFKEV